jgi:hypothetical protein
MQAIFRLPEIFEPDIRELSTGSICHCELNQPGSIGPAVTLPASVDKLGRLPAIGKPNNHNFVHGLPPGFELVG